MDSGLYPEHFVDQMASQKQIMEQFYNNDKLSNPSDKQGKSSLEMLRLSCEQLQAKPPNSMRTVQEQKAVETVSSAYDKMSEVDAFNILKKKILKDTTHCHLWMFLFDILLDSNKSNVATWEDQKGMFRIRDPTKLADMWGEKRNRTNMTYEKLSRSLRHYYEKKILRKVPKRKYTYKFNSREILKSYEVQPYYRRSTNSQAQRNSAAQVNPTQHVMTPGYQPSPTSSQASPFYSPVTPSPSYHQNHASFNWNQTLPQGWPKGLDSPQACHQHPSPAYHVATSMANPEKQWPQPMLVGFSSRSVEQQIVQSPMAAPTVPPIYTPNLMQANHTTAAQVYQDSHHFMTDLVNGEAISMVTEEKPSAGYIMENIDNIINKSKGMPKTGPAPAVAAYGSSHNALYNQNNSNSNHIPQTRCRSNSITSYESSSPDSYYSNDAMFNDIMESLVMEAF